VLSAACCLPVRLRELKNDISWRWFDVKLSEAVLQRHVLNSAVSQRDCALDRRTEWQEAVKGNVQPSQWRWTAGTQT
jgi:hypothetical protein